MPNLVRPQSAPAEEHGMTYGWRAGFPSRQTPTSCEVSHFLWGSVGVFQPLLFRPLRAYTSLPDSLTAPAAPREVSRSPIQRNGRRHLSLGKHRPGQDDQNHTG